MSMQSRPDRGFYQDPYTLEVWISNPELVDVSPEGVDISEIGDVVRFRASGGTDMPYDFKPLEVITREPKYEQGVLTSSGKTSFRLVRFTKGRLDPQSPNYIFDPHHLSGFSKHTYGDRDVAGFVYAYFKDPEPFKRIVLPTGFAYGIAEGRLAQGVKIRRPTWYLKAVQLGISEGDDSYVWQTPTEEVFPLTGIVGLMANGPNK